MNYQLSQFRKMSDIKYYILMFALVPMSVLTIFFVPTIFVFITNILTLLLSLYLCYKKHREELVVRKNNAENEDFILEYTHCLNRKGNA